MLKGIFSTAETAAKRFWEIDFLRGAAIILMIASNFATDLAYFKIANINTDGGFWWFFSRLAATIFIFLVGVSLTLSYSRAEKHKTGKELQFKYLKRGLKIFSWGLIITFVSWIFLGNDFIIFGVLHLIGLSIILAYPLLKCNLGNLFLGAVFITLGAYAKGIIVGSPWLLWLGIMPRNFYSVDYFPLIPWFGVVLIGIFVGNVLYSGGLRKYKIFNAEKFSSVKGLCFLGRNSLLIYLIHQPILLLGLKILGLLPL